MVSNGTIMNGILYLMSRTLINRFKRLLHKPGLLVLYLFLIVSLAFSLISSLLSPSVPATSMKPIWLLIFYAAYLMIFYFTSVYKGLSSGSSFFDMSDVNLLFCAPINSKQILCYGLLSQAGKSLLGGFFLLYQGGTFKSMGLTAFHLILFFVGYVLALILCELMSMAIYIVSNQNNLRKNVIKAISILPVALFALYYIYTYLKVGSYKEALLLSVQKGGLKLIPIVGWITESLRKFLAGDLPAIGSNLLLTLLIGVLFLAVIMLYHSDYYEDVLVATETAFEKKRAISDGNLNALGSTSKKINKGKRSLIGSGSTAIFYKHLLESSRNNRFFLLDAGSLFIIAGANLAAFLNGSSHILLILLAVSMYLQCFFIGTGRGLKELYSHYIYLIPESSFQKIIWSNGEVILKQIAESALMFIPAIFFTDWNPVTVLLCVVIRSFFAMFLVTANMLSQRIFKDVISQGLLAFIYLFFIVLTMFPGIIAAIVLNMAGNLWLGFFALCLWEFLLSLLFFFLSRGVLHNSDMPVMIKKNL